ncbi:LytTR family DNA-binding domain-containing protein [Sulfitobacter geojensis]|uniref:LytTR family DNA-binding domain-containing protein n=1 Tax=Sulfitobacter geojensis TaxID=1342299 RepID=UPI0009EEC575|nr:LytTR family DNA-binding domain-containing protein [Sulfitobacter geojensis]
MVTRRYMPHFTLREWRKARVPVGIWLLVTVICTIAGPFGTIDALGWAERFGYWGIIAAVSVLGSILLMRADNLPSPLRVGLWALFTLVLSVMIWGINILLFDAWLAFGQLGYLLFTVGASVISVHAAFWLIEIARPVVEAPARPKPDPVSQFMQRLPLAQRGPLIRLEAQDHYLNVVTTKGSALILMRLGDAAQDLTGVNGLLVHRSHWIALDAVTAHRREKGRDVLTLSDGSEVPVSRTYRAAAKEAGLF